MVLEHRYTNTETEVFGRHVLSNSPLLDIVHDVIENLQSQPPNPEHISWGLTTYLEEHAALRASMTRSITDNFLLDLIAVTMKRIDYRNVADLLIKIYETTYPITPDPETKP